MTETEKQTGQNVEIAVIGAGLVGSLLAIYLAKRGLEVDVFERRPDMRKAEISAGRSINLNITVRGIEALKRVGIADEVLAEVIPMKGRLMHSRTGELTFQPYGKDDTEVGHSISRAGLNISLMNKAEETGKVRFHFEMKAADVDFSRNTLLFQHKDGSIEKVHAGLIFGTDGSGSEIRQAMAKISAADAKSSGSRAQGSAAGATGAEPRAQGPGGLTEDSVVPLDYGYKELYIAPTAGGEFQIEKNALHIWPRGTYMMIALPNFDGSFTVTLFLPYEGDVSFEKLQTRDDVLSFFKEQFPDSMALMPDLADAFLENPTGHMDTVKCYPWNVGGRAILMGDAAHGVVPFFGQGMNCGFEDLSVFDECIDEHVKSRGALYVEKREVELEKRKGAQLKRQTDMEHNWERLFADFLEKRKVNTDAIADMAVDNFIEMRDRVADPKFLLAKAVEKVLEKKFPGRYMSRYALVTFSHVPYKLALDAGVICDEILAELCKGIEKADDVDLKLAEQLIDRKLAPLLEKQPELAKTR